MNAQKNTQISVPRKALSSVRTGVRAGGCNCIHCRPTKPA